MSITSATMIFGDSGGGKSSLLATLARWMWKKHKKVSLLYYTDGGGFPTIMEALIKAGIVRVWKLRTRGEAFESCARACQGYWPVEFIDPLGGETAPGVQLVPGIGTTFTLSCPSCKTEIAKRSSRRGFSQMQLCPKCKNRVSLQNGIVDEKTTVAPFFKDVGTVMYDSLTSMNDWIMIDMADRMGRGELGGAGAAIGGRIVSGDMVFGGSNQSHYGYAQTRSAQWVQDASNIKGLTIGPVFTARKQRAVDKESKVRIYGPQIAGQAKTSDVPAWVGNCLGTSVLLDEKGRKEWRLYLTEYQEPGDDVIHLCKVRSAPGTVPDYLSDGPVDSATNKPVSGVEPFTHFNLGYLMELLEAASEKTLKETIKEFPDAPGLNYLKEMKKEVQTEKPKPPPPGPLKPSVVPIRPGPRPGKK